MSNFNMLLKMRKFETSAYGVEGLSKQDAKAINGGIAWFPIVLSVLAGGLVYDIVSNPSETAKNFMTGYRMARALK